MKNPTKDEIENYVHTVIGIWVNRDPLTLKEKDELAKNLNLGSLGFRTLSGALRNYLQRFKPKKTLTVRELKKAKTVGSTTALVVKKIIP